MRFTSMLGAMVVVAGCAFMTGFINPGVDADKAFRITMGGIAIYTLGLVIDIRKDIGELKDARNS